jgi:hypothetical protein
MQRGLKRPKLFGGDYRATEVKRQRPRNANKQLVLYGAVAGFELI